VSELTPLGGWLHQAETYVRRFVVLADEQAVAVVLWIAHTHAFAAAIATPYLSVSSAEMESGKTRLLEVLRILVANPWFTGRTTAAALVRKIDKAAPTLLLDEGDPAFNGDREYAEVLRGVLNTGYRKGGAVTVCAGQGANLDVRDFSTFSPKAIAGIGRLPDTVESRSIPIRLKKRLATEEIERFRERKARAAGEAIADGLATFLEPLLGDLEAAEPELPDELSDREQDVWEPLLAIGDAAGGEWSPRARRAAVALSSREPDDATLGVRLLADIREAFDDEEQLATADLLRRLRQIEESPWGGWNDGDGIRPRELANKLRPYGVKSRDVHVEGEGRRRTVKGYRSADLEDAWGRYVPVTPDSIRAKRANGSTEPKAVPPQARQDPLVARIENAEKRLDQADGADGADSEGEHGDARVDSPPDDAALRRVIEWAEGAERRAAELGLDFFDEEPRP
jgi:hypothetical protein